MNKIQIYLPMLHNSEYSMVQIELYLLILQNNVPIEHNTSLPTNLTEQPGTNKTLPTHLTEQLFQWNIK